MIRSQFYYYLSEIGSLDNNPLVSQSISRLNDILLAVIQFSDYG